MQQIALAVIGPLAFMMGMPMPSGLRILAAQGEDLVPWAWGVNGVASVLGSVLAVVLAGSTLRHTMNPKHCIVPRGPRMLTLPDTAGRCRSRWCSPYSWLAPTRGCRGPLIPSPS